MNNWQKLFVAAFFIGSSLAHAQTSERWQILNAENQRRADDPVFQQVLAGENLELKILALRSLGRIGHPKSAPQIISALSNPDPAVRSEAAFAAGLLGGAEVAAAVKERVNLETSWTARDRLIEAFSRTAPVTDASIVAGLYVRANPLEPADVYQKALGTFAQRFTDGLHLEPQVIAKLIESSFSPDAEIALTAAFALSRYRNDFLDVQKAQMIQLFSSRPIANEDSAAAVALVVRALGRTKDSAAKKAILDVLQKPLPYLGLKIELLRALSNFAYDADVAGTLKTYLRDTNSSVVVQTLQVIQGFSGQGTQDFSPELATTSRTQPSEWVQGEILVTKALLERDGALDLIRQSAIDPHLVIQSRFAISALAKVNTAKAFSALQQVYSQNPKSNQGAIGEALSGFSDGVLKSAVETPAFLKKLIASDDVALVAAAADVASRLNLKECTQPLLAAYPRMQQMDQTEGRIAILSALGTLGSSSELTFIENALRENVRQVQLAAADAYKQISGKDISSRVAPVTRVLDETPPLAALEEAARKVATVRTSHGAFRMRMLSEAPLSAYNFVMLAQTGFYNHLIFHRLVPNFVVQGGDPRGDGYGGPQDFFVREEISELSHRAGFVGMATAGKDTAGSQWFVNLAPNLHLDGNYTIFAEIIDGFDSLSALELGDEIYSVEIR